MSQNKLYAPQDSLEYFLQQMWADYCHMSPQAQAIADQFKQANETLVNDHNRIKDF